MYFPVIGRRELRESYSEINSLFAVNAYTFLFVNPSKGSFFFVINVDIFLTYMTAYAAAVWPLVCSLALMTS